MGMHIMPAPTKASLPTFALPPPRLLPSSLQKLVEREEREKRRAEAAKEKEDARRYPMEDLELLQELREKAAEAGGCCICCACICVALFFFRGCSWFVVGAMVRLGAPR